MNKMMKLAGATLAATGEVAMSGIVASGAAAYSVVKAFQSATKRVTDAWKEDKSEETVKVEVAESVQEEIAAEPVGAEESENLEVVQEERAENE